MGNQMFRNLGMEDFAMPVGMENQMGLNYGMESAMPSETFMPVSYGTVNDRGRQGMPMPPLNTGEMNINNTPFSGIGMAGTQLGSPSTYETKVPYASPGGMFNSANRPDLASSGFDSGSYMQETMYPPTTMPTRSAGYGGMGMNQDFRFMI